ncbi:atypical protein kinase C-like isoform X2 [Nilaparvata lugens]|uniref:atypical protein kinase C-like isoform X2 n=1 Tax=Nilaparvata lugens TaxID=108931 RepID=UPI00193DA935|nr:atypical protein kinase C-like isoform X2 [Nilaparvata lugens]
MSSAHHANESEVPDIRVNTAYNGEIMITYIDPHITVEQLSQLMREICRFSQDQVFTMKWVDEEGDPCIITTQMELDEAIRLYEFNKDSELTIHGKCSCFQVIFQKKSKFIS